MANEKVISTEALIAQFQYALDNDWGYIYATAGVMWTAEKQADLEKTTDESRAMGRKYGSKWIGHMVADCSGLFAWAFKQFGGYMYHGSDTMFRKYTTASGELKKGKRTDGRELLPGTAVFTYNKDTKKYGHVGLYIGNGLVIEAEGTIHGVVTSKVDGKWTYWGELKGVDYGYAPQPEPQPEPGTAIVTGKNLALREGPSTNCKVITRAPTGSVVKIETPPYDWEYVEYKGKRGYMMKQYLKE